MSASSTPNTGCSCASTKTSICRRDGIDVWLNSFSRRPKAGLRRAQSSRVLGRSAWRACVRCWAGVVGRGRAGRAATRPRPQKEAARREDFIPHPSSFIPAKSAERIGWVVDRGRTLRDGPDLPARVATLDELLLVVRRDTPLRFDPALGFHLYGADICLQAAERGLAVVAVAALCHHNSRSVGLPAAFYRSAEVFARKWSHRLPVATPCVIIDRGGEVRLLGNAVTKRPTSIAYASVGH